MYSLRVWQVRWDQSIGENGHEWIGSIEVSCFVAVNYRRSELSGAEDVQNWKNWMKHEVIRNYHSTLPETMLVGHASDRPRSDLIHRSDLFGFLEWAILREYREPKTRSVCWHERCAGNEDAGKITGNHWGLIDGGAFQ